MTFEVALPDMPARRGEPFCIARSTEPRRCIALARPLLEAIEAVVRMRVLLVHREGNGELRSFGASEHTLLLTMIDLDSEHWVSIDVSDQTTEHACAA